MEMKYDYDTENGEVFKLEIEYEYAPYHPADMNGPAEGGYSEGITFTVIGYRQYNEDGELIIDWPVLTPEIEKELTAKFNAMVDANDRLQEYFQIMVDADAVSAMEPDYE